MRILGLDPGLADVGFAILERCGGGWVAVQHGTISTRKEDGQPRRLAEIYTDTSAVLREAGPIAFAAIEDYRSFGQFNTNAGTLQRVIGVVIAALALHGVVQVVEVGQGEWRKVVAPAPAGVDTRKEKEAARKMRTRAAVQQRFGLPALPRTSHEADALGIAAWLTMHQAVVRAGGAA